MPMEIERKFTLKAIPEQLNIYPSIRIVQGYLNTDPVVRIRQENENYFLTYKGKGMMAREEYNLPLNAESFAHLIKKCDGHVISKTRYLIPLIDPKFSNIHVQPPEDYSLTIELDIFDPPFAPLILAEVEFGSLDAAESFIPPDWFLEDVTFDRNYHNSNLSKKMIQT